MKKIIFFLAFLVLASGNLHAKEAVILYTGQTHAMLYPCSCPLEPDGGVSRRATLVKEMRRKYPGLLLLDGGSFTAGGLMDEYAGDAGLDTLRSQVNFRAMKLMRYDAVAVGPDELNFGRDFFLRNAGRSNPAFLSANLDSKKVLPYTVKSSGGIKIGIIGLTDPQAAKNAQGLKISQPEADAIEGIVKRLKKQGVEVVILLSTLGERQDLKLLSQVKGIDILFTGYNLPQKEMQDKAGSTFIVRPAWQGRKLGKLTLEVKDGKLVNCKIEEERLSDKIADDPQVESILPVCYSDANCRKEGMVASCKNPGELKASCVFTEPNKVSLLIINTKDCAICQAEPALGFLKKEFPGIVAEHIYLPDPAAEELVKELKVRALPVYLLGREVEQEKNFDKMKNVLQLNGKFYMLRPEASGIAYFLDRPLKKGSLDLFLSLFDEDTYRLLDTVREFGPQLHFLAVEKKGGGFDAKYGGAETEEYLRSVCVRRYYPKKFWEYLTCRSKNIKGSSWEACLGKANIAKLKACAGGKQGAQLLGEDIALSKELQIMFGPTYLLDNREIFASRGVPSKEELKRLIKR